MHELLRRAAHILLRGRSARHNALSVYRQPAQRRGDLASAFAYFFVGAGSCQTRTDASSRCAVASRVPSGLMATAREASAIEVMTLPDATSQTLTVGLAPLDSNVAIANRRPSALATARACRPFWNLPPVMRFRSPSVIPDRAARSHFISSSPTALTSPVEMSQTERVFSGSFVLVKLI